MLKSAHVLLSPFSCCSLQNFPNLELNLCFLALRFGACDLHNSDFSCWVSEAFHYFPCFFLASPCFKELPHRPSDAGRCPLGKWDGRWDAETWHLRLKLDTRNSSRVHLGWPCKQILETNCRIIVSWFWMVMVILRFSQLKPRSSVLAFLWCQKVLRVMSLVEFRVDVTRVSDRGDSDVSHFSPRHSRSNECSTWVVYSVGTNSLGFLVFLFWNSAEATETAIWSQI